MVRLFSTVGNFFCSYWPVLGSHNMMLTFFSLFTSFLLVSCVRSSVNRPPPVCFVFVENFSLTGNDDPSQNNQKLIFVLFPHFLDVGLNIAPTQEEVFLSVTIIKYIKTCFRDYVIGAFIDIDCQVGLFFPFLANWKYVVAALKL